MYKQQGKENWGDVQFTVKVTVLLFSSSNLFVYSKTTVNSWFSPFYLCDERWAHTRVCSFLECWTCTCFNSFQSVLFTSTSHTHTYTHITIVYDLYSFKVMKLAQRHHQRKTVFSHTWTNTNHCHFSFDVCIVTKPNETDVRLDIRTKRLFLYRTR